MNIVVAMLTVLLMAAMLMAAMLVIARLRGEVRGWKRQSAALIEANKGLAQEHARINRAMQLDMDGMVRALDSLKSQLAEAHEELGRMKWGVEVTMEEFGTAQERIEALVKERDEAYKTIADLHGLLDRKVESLSRARAEKAKVHAQLKTAEIKILDLRNELRIVKNDYDALEALLQEGAGAS